MSEMVKPRFMIANNFSFPWITQNARGEENSVQYVSVDAFINGIMARGRGTLMAKVDVVSAYRNVAIHPDDCSLL